MSAVTLATLLVSLPVMTMFGILLAELVAGQFAPRNLSTDQGRLGSVVVMIPAHNEAHGIQRCIAGVLADASAGLTVLVVADNCTDATAQLARSAGAEVVERNDPDRRGKGYALAFGRDALQAAPPSVLIVLDADCQADPATLLGLAAAAVAAHAPVQACNLLTSDNDDSPVVQISNFAFLLKNRVRQRGLDHLGGIAVLTGTGMAFPWEIFATVGLASGNIVEDLALGVDLARAGYPPRYIDRLRVESAAAPREETLQQRRRWEHGFVASARNHALPLIAEGLFRRRAALLVLGGHLAVPPLALLFLLGVLNLGALVTVGLFGQGFVVAMLLTGLIVSDVAMIALSWHRFGRDTVSLSAIAQIPRYVLWKIPNYVRLLSGPEKTWTRTKREGE